MRIENLATKPARAVLRAGDSVRLLYQRFQGRVCGVCGVCERHDFLPGFFAAYDGSVGCGNPKHTLDSGQPDEYSIHPLFGGCMPERVVVCPSSVWKLGGCILSVDLPRGVALFYEVTYVARKRTSTHIRVRSLRDLEELSCWTLSAAAPSDAASVGVPIVRHEYREWSLYRDYAAYVELCVKPTGSKAGNLLVVTRWKELHLRVWTRRFNGNEKLTSYAFLDAEHIIALVTVDDTIQMQVYRLALTSSDSGTTCDPVSLHGERTSTEGAVVEQQGATDAESQAPTPILTLVFPRGSRRGRMLENSMRPSSSPADSASPDSASDNTQREPARDAFGISFELSMRCNWSETTRAMLRELDGDDIKDREVISHTCILFVPTSTIQSHLSRARENEGAAAVAKPEPVTVTVAWNDWGPEGSLLLYDHFEKSMKRVAARPVQYFTCGTRITLLKEVFLSKSLSEQFGRDIVRVVTYDLDPEAAARHAATQASRIRRAGRTLRCIANIALGRSSSDWDRSGEMDELKDFYGAMDETESLRTVLPHATYCGPRIDAFDTRVVGAGSEGPYILDMDGGRMRSTLKRLTYKKPLIMARFVR